MHEALYFQALARYEINPDKQIYLLEQSREIYKRLHGENSFFNITTCIELAYIYKKSKNDKEKGYIFERKFIMGVLNKSP